VAGACLAATPGITRATAAATAQSWTQRAVGDAQRSAAPLGGGDSGPGTNAPGGQLSSDFTGSATIVPLNRTECSSSPRQEEPDAKNACPMLNLYRDRTSPGGRLAIRGFCAFIGDRMPFTTGRLILGRHLEGHRASGRPSPSPANRRYLSRAFAEVRFARCFATRCSIEPASSQSMPSWIAVFRPTGSTHLRSARSTPLALSCCAS